MNRLVMLAFLASAAFAQDVIGPFSSANNIAGDLSCEPDARATTWGGTTAFASTIKFIDVPTGYRVRILKVYGDFIAMPKGPVNIGTAAEVGWGLKSTKPDGSEHTTYPGYSSRPPFDSSFVWRQDLVTSANQGVSVHFDYDTHVGGLLEEDNILISQMFVALNTTGLVMHEEPTFVIVYQYEKQGLPIPAPKIAR